MIGEILKHELKIDSLLYKGRQNGKIMMPILFSV